MPYCRLLFIFLSVTLAHLIVETTHSGFLTCSDYSLCRSVRELMIRSWISENEDLQPSGVLSLHMFWSVGSCKNVSLVYIKSLNISSTLCSLVGVWKLLFEWFSFFLVANYSPITVIYIHLHQFICHVKFV